MTIDQKVRFAKFAGAIQALCFLGFGSYCLVDAIREPRVAPIFFVVVCLVGLCANRLQHGPRGFYSPDAIRQRLEGSEG